MSTINVMSATKSDLTIAATQQRHPAREAREDVVPVASAPEGAEARFTPQRRRLFGAAVVTGAVLLQAGTQFYVIPDKFRAAVHSMYLAIEVPILMVALSATHAWALRRNMSSARAIVSGSLVAGTIGFVGGALLWFVQQYLGVRNVPLEKATLFGLSFSQLYFGIWALAFVYPFAQEDARVRALEADKLRSMAELSRLRAHLEPHFLLNTLNAIAGLVTEDPREARRLIACLGDLLRDALRDDHEFQSLKEEVAWLKRYAAILEARHRGELLFQWHIAKELSDVQLPRLLLQPLVENAVKHGALRRKGGGGEVTVRAFVEGEEAVFVVEDNGPGVPEKTRNGTFGLTSVRQRLSLRYPGSALRLASSATGTVSTVAIPRAALVKSGTS
ncbi:histidine kinase [Pendulispora rubella]|uniref:Histidine kinase n=1 Tax=Pendulispora rubella TaxID=2741070 RepID=A0ABZ2LFJ0_9BACT